MSLHSYTKTFLALLETDFKIYKRTVKDKLINVFIWILTIVLVTAYLMPFFGLHKSYIPFTCASLIASAGLFEIFPSAANFISDLEGNNIISFYLTLPIPSWLIFVRNILFYSFNTITLAFFVLPLCKILLGNDFPLSQFNFVQFILMFTVTALFYAAFTVWITSRIVSMEKIENIWMRFVYPLWFLGGFQYSYKVLHAFNPWLAYSNLADPILYVMEGMRAAVLGQEGSLNVWICITVLSICTIGFGWIGIARLKQRLDFI